jgi:hypothetical protein
VGCNLSLDLMGWIMRGKLVVCCGILFNALVLASTHGPARAMDALEPGLWRFTWKANNGGQALVPSTITRCITPDRAKSFATATSIDVKRDGLACRSFGHRNTENGEVLDLHCTAGKFNFNATVTYTLNSPQRYTIVFDAAVPLKKMTLHWSMKTEGDRIGECPK